KPGDRIDNIVPEVETSPGAQQEPEYANVQDQRDEDISPVDRVAENGGEQQRQQIAAVSEDVGVVVQEADGGGIEHETCEHQHRGSEAKLRHRLTTASGWPRT